MNVPVVAVVGGPLGGRSTFLVCARDMLEKHGYHVFVLPEAATELITMGASPAVLGSQVFQERLLQHSILLEDELLDTARQLQLENWRQPDAKVAVAILCPGGVPDAATRMGLVAYERLLIERARHPEAMRQRYSHVVHLATPAMELTTEEFSRLPGVSERQVTRAQAREIEERVSTAWRGHANIIRVDFAEDFTRKILQALRQLAEGFGLPPPTGVERAFRVDNFNEEMLPKDSRKTLISEDYLLSSGLGERQIRKRVIADDVSYAYCEQLQAEAHSWKYERARLIRLQEYQQLLMDFRDTALWTVERTRHVFSHEGTLNELDTFEGRRGGLAILRCEVPDSGADVSIPVGMQVVEVTGNVRYSNRTLADPTNKEE